MLYKYSKIDLSQFAVLTDKVPADDAEIEFNISTEFGFDRNNHIFANTITLRAQCDGEILMKAVMTSYFDIAPESIDEITDDEGKIVFDPMTLIQFVSLNYGSLRGALYVKTADTPMKDVVTPPFYFHKIITSAFVTGQ